MVTDPPGTETLLVVEDDDALREVVQRPLVAAGYQVLLAADGLEAVRISREHSGVISLLLTDVIMPQMNGRAVADDLQRQRPGIKVLYMSGYTDNALAQHGVLDEDTHLLTKPFTVTTLLNKVRELLDSTDARPSPTDHTAT
jgi:CheY-like chemotaxis protein